MGGRARPVTVDGRRFHVVPPFVVLPAAVRDTFVKTGRPAHTAFDLEPAADTNAHFADGTTARLANDADAAAVIGRTLGPQAEAHWAGFMEAGERLWAQVRTPYVESAGPMPTWRERMRCRRAPTAHGLARRSLADEHLVRLVDHQVAWAGSDPRLAPSALAVLPYVEHAFRRWRLVGGMSVLIDELERRARHRGVEIRTGVTATSIRSEGGRVTGVDLADGTALAADIVVTAAPEPVVAGLLGQPMRRPSSGASAFLLLLELAPGRGRGPGRSLWFGADADAELDAVFGSTPTPVEDPTAEVTTTPYDGHESWVVRVPAPAADRHDWTPEVGRHYADHLVERLAARGCDIRDRISFRRWMTPADIAAAGGDDLGWVNGPARSRRDPLPPANTGGVPGLFHVGDGVHPGGGVTGALLSAGIVADLVGRP